MKRTAANRAEVQLSVVDNSEDHWAVKIRTSWQKTLEGILETGAHLIQAKEALPHGGFEIMVHDDLPFGARTARKLMAIARSPVLSDRTHASVLPPHSETLYELTKLDESDLKVALHNHLIKPELQRKDLPKLRRRMRGWRHSSNRKRPTVQRSFLAELRQHFGADSRSWLDGLEPRKRGELIERIVALVNQEHDQDE